VISYFERSAFGVNQAACVPMRIHRQPAAYC